MTDHDLEVKPDPDDDGKWIATDNGEAFAWCNTESEAKTAKDALVQSRT